MGRRWAGMGEVSGCGGCWSARAWLRWSCSCVGKSAHVQQGAGARKRTGALDGVFSSSRTLPGQSVARSSGAARRRRRCSVQAGFSLDAIRLKGVRRKQRNVVACRSRSGRDADVDNVQAEDRGRLRKRPCLHHEAAGRGWWPRRMRARMRHGSELPPTGRTVFFLQCAQQLGLQVERKLANLVEEDRATIGRRRADRLPANAFGEPGKRAFDASQRARFRSDSGDERPAVNGDERFGARWRR